MKVNRLGKSKLGQGSNSWQQAKHTWLYSDLLHAFNENICQPWFLNRGDFNFCNRCVSLQEISK